MSSRRWHTEFTLESSSKVRQWDEAHAQEVTMDYSSQKEASFRWHDETLMNLKSKSLLLYNFLLTLGKWLDNLKRVERNDYVRNFI